MSDDIHIPHWALACARGAIRCGHPVPDIEAKLVTKGLSPAAATKAVNRCFDAVFQADLQSRRRQAQLRWLNRGLSGAFAGVMVGLICWENGFNRVFGAAVWLFPPLAFIWFADAFGAYIGGGITDTTPGCLVATGGWILLVGVPLLGWLLRL